MPLLCGYLRNERIRSRSVKRELRKVQSDNRGFTLLEVLVSMVILTIICVPLLRSFATSAQTDAKAKLQMKATTAGENIMEKIKNMTSDELDDIVTGSGHYATASGITYTSTSSGVTYSISGDMIYFDLDKDQLNNDFNADMPDGSTAHVELNPIGKESTTGGWEELYYPYANGLNMADLSSISVRDCAIYTMDSGCDIRAYDEYEIRNAAIRGPADPVYDAKKDLTRSIDITTEDTGGVYTTEWGETRSTYRIKLKIWYHANKNGVVANRDYTETEVFLFDNTASHKDVQGIYLFYYPRYEAAYNSPGRDQINVINDAGVKTEFYVTAMNGSPDLIGTPSGATTGVKNNYLLANKGLLLTIIDSNALDADGKGCIKLRTNLLKINTTTGARTPYSKNDTNAYGLGCTLKYKASTYNVNDEAAKIKALSVANVDGKALNMEDTQMRIYHVSVDVYGPDGTVLSSMNGTKLRQEE